VGSAAAGSWGDLVHRRPEAFTALSFSDPAQLPSEGRPGEEIRVSYTVTNHRADDVLVEETASLLEQPGGSSAWSLEHSQSLPAGVSDTRALVVRLPPLPPPASAWRLEVRLASGENVYHTIRPAP
jgi:hypothetical protein